MADAQTAMLEEQKKGFEQDLGVAREMLEMTKKAGIPTGQLQAGIEILEKQISDIETLLAQVDLIMTSPTRVGWARKPNRRVTVRTWSPAPELTWEVRAQAEVCTKNGTPFILADRGESTPLLTGGVLRGSRVIRPLILREVEGGGWLTPSLVAAEKHLIHRRAAPFVLHGQGALEDTAHLVERRVDDDASKGYRFTLLTHPAACKLLTAVRRGGIDALLSDRDIQVKAHDALALVADAGIKERARDAVSFAATSPSSIYNWEIYFHVPLYIATRLTAERRFDEARKWMERIFDPTQGGPGPSKKGAEKPWAKPPLLYWKPRPFFENADLTSIQEELSGLAKKGTPTYPGIASYMKAMKELEAGEDSAALYDIEAQIAAWREAPFDPYAVAGLRTVAFQKAVVIRYAKNLIEWGDDLFRRETIEAINEALELYVFARHLLGAKPTKITPPAPAEVKMVEELSELDAFSNALVETESLVPVQPAACGVCVGPKPPDLRTLYFCIPGNDYVDELRDSVADRLFKIRHCMNIDGVVRELPLFEPPIDPALLVQAAAAGVDISSVLADLSTTRTPYRFQVAHGRAMDLASGVVQLGQALLQLFEKRDAEELALLRSGQEVDVLAALRGAKALEVKEAERSLAAAREGKKVIERRRDHYRALLAAGLNEEERSSMARAQLGMLAGLASASLGAMGAGMSYIPDVEVGQDGFNPTTSTRPTGGDKIALSFELGAQAASTTATVLQFESTRLASSASYRRRAEEWSFQVKNAEAEVLQIAKQVAAGEVRLAVLQAFLEAHDRQVANAKTVDDFMRSKLTGEDLYEWMVGRASEAYYAAYKLAYDMAKRAEMSLRMELGIPDSEPRQVTFGYWDSARKGLMAGERLLQSLRALDAAYHLRNRRELELTKHVSLLAVAPDELIKLRETGSCAVEVAEKLFDYDYPGHYLRRLRSVSISVPSVTGPYIGVSCTLLMEENRMRRSVSLTLGYAEALPPADDPRFSYQVTPIEAIVTSSAQNDAGLFDPSLGDPRYLPFEGAGAVSTWKVDLPPKSNAFDVSRISDLVLHLRYTARDGGALLHDAALASVANREGLKYLVSARMDFAVAWDAFMNPQPEDDEQVLTLPITEAMFPYLHGQQSIGVTGVELLFKWSPALYGDGDPLMVTVDRPGGATNETLDEVAPYNLPGQVFGNPGAVGTWTITISKDDIAGLAEGLFTWVDQKARLNETLVDIWLLFTIQAHMST